MNKKIKVLSLFDGISCGHIALERAGFEVEIYYASEIDESAKLVTQSNYPNTIQLGNALDIDFNSLLDKGIDMVIGGSPCTTFSVARREREISLDGVGGQLFGQFKKAIDILKPKYFLLENVASMHNDVKNLISQSLGVEPVMINSALVSAQQRKRYYWCNWAVEQPEDKGLIIDDIIEEPELKGVGTYISGEYNGVPLDTFIAPCALRTRGYKKVIKDGEEVWKRTDEKGEGIERVKRLEVKTDGKCNNMTTVASDSMVLIRLDKPERVGQLNNSKAQANRIYSIRGKSVCLMGQGGGLGAKTGLYKIDLPDGDYIVRSLSPIECERLQTLPDNYTVKAKKTQRLKQCGNGWTVDVIAHIFRQIGF